MKTLLLALVLPISCYGQSFDDLRSRHEVAVHQELTPGFLKESSHEDLIALAVEKAKEVYRGEEKVIRQYVSDKIEALAPFRALKEKEKIPSLLSTTYTDDWSYFVGSNPIEFSYHVVTSQIALSSGPEKMGQEMAIKSLIPWKVFRGDYPQSIIIETHDTIYVLEYKYHDSGFLKPTALYKEK